MLHLMDHWSASSIYFENPSSKEDVDDIADEMKEDDNCRDDGISVDDSYEKKPLLPANISLIVSKYCVHDDEPWIIEDYSSSSDESDPDLPSTCSELFRAANPKTQGTGKAVLIPDKKLKNSSCVNLMTSNDKKFEKQKFKEESYSPPTAKKRKYSQGNNVNGIDVNSKSTLIKFECSCLLDQMSVNKERLEVNVKAGESSEELMSYKNINGSQDNSETNRILSDLPDLTSTANLTGPSCSTDLTDTSSSMFRSHCSSNLPASSMDKEQESEFLFDFCNKSYGYRKPVTISKNNNKSNQEISVFPIEKCHLIKQLSKNLKLVRNKVTDSQMDNSECFVEDKDFVNPDISYNISLNEHYKQMDHLVQKISKITDDQTLLILDECMHLMLIPQVEHEKKTFTIEERLNFLHGIPEWEYDIDGDDWNKIMVKRAVVFTAHAGFSMANEESLYVLADVAIDYIKKLAIIMKRNFDIQSNSSCLSVVDPINNSLQEIGVNGGISELIRHYENDVYDRRSKLIKKCQHLKKIIDQFVERMLLNPKMKNQYVIKQEPGEESLANGKCMKRENNVLSKEIKIETDSSITEVRSDIQTKIENFKMESQWMTEENVFTNTEVEQTEPVYVDNMDNEVKLDTDQKNVENIRSEPMDIDDRKINYMRTVDLEIKDFDLLKPITPYVYHEPEMWTVSKIDRKYPSVSESRNRNVFDVRNFDSPYNLQILDRPQIFSSCSKSYANHKKYGKSLDSDDVKRPIIRSFLQTTKEKCDKNPVQHKKVLDDFENSFKRFNISHPENCIPSNVPIKIEYENDFINDDFTAFKTKVVNTNGFDVKKESTPNES